ncbi:MAG: DMT family transporter [Gallionella sp.]|nr:DMT family transporter [Gallionella sp.]
MTPPRLIALTTLTMIAFAANSVLCRMALKDTGIDAASFTALRLLSGAAMLWLLMRWQQQAALQYGNWRSALALFIYAAAFSFAYRTINAGAGALMLFGAVQATMLIAGFIAGERLRRIQAAGFVTALAGLVMLVLPGVEAPSVPDSLLMLASGVAWGIYSLWGRGLANPAAATAGNFVRAAPLALVLAGIALPWLQWDARGALYAVLSGAITSALGYVLWYRVLQHLRAMTASTVQLSAPIIASLGGVVVLGEMFTPDLFVASVLVLGGLWLVLRYGKIGL